MLLAIDHGNKQIKTIHCPPFVSGLQQSITKPFGENIIQCNGTYYALSNQRIPYRKDKTEDDRFFHLTLFGAANEIEAMKCYTEEVIRIQLAVGLPPAHFGAQNKSFIRYFKDRDVIKFSYHGKPHSIYIEDVACFPQAYAAAVTMMESLIDSPKALVLDIGGFTADYLLMKYGQADLSTCDSLENGVILLYSRIRSKINAELDLLLEESDIDAILKGQTDGYTEKAVRIVEYQAQEFINDLFSTLRERMIDLRSGTVVFVGGGAILLRRQIEASGKIGRLIFVDEINANAKGYEFLYQLEMAGR